MLNCDFADEIYDKMLLQSALKSSNSSRVDVAFSTYM